jgi:hypothetical protein
MYAKKPTFMNYLKLFDVVISQKIHVMSKITYYNDIMMTF